MDQPGCSCAKFDRLEGASALAYTKAFLEESRGPTSLEKNRYRCRVCGREWERREPEVKSEGTRASLVRLSE
ncbi:MAG TPA: hypothetical protein VF528_09055 [Pyrinomonadaceae bacterium]|jgi:hypothetical protein